MQLKKVLLLAVLFGAMLGAKSLHIDFHVIGDKFPPLAPDRSLLSYRGFLLAGVAIWALFGIYWEIAAKNAAEAKISESRRSRGVHVVLVNAALVLEIVPIRGLGRYLPASSTIMAAGLAVETMGLFLLSGRGVISAETGVGKLRSRWSINSSVPVRTGDCGTLSTPASWPCIWVWLW